MIASLPNKANAADRIQRRLICAVGRNIMKDVLKEYRDLRGKAQTHGNQVSNALGIQTHEMPAGVFGMVFNDLTLALELLYYYFNIWGKQTTTACASVEEARTQNAQRVIAIQKMVFIATMSSFEFCAKECINNNPQRLGSLHGRVYLKGIMEKSKDNSIIPHSDFTLWEGVVNLRNALVHNNGISEIDAVYNYPQCTLTMENGKMTQGDLRLFSGLTEWVLDSMRSWLLDFSLP